MLLGVEKMKNNKILFLYFIILLLIVFFEYKNQNTFLEENYIHNYEIKDNKELDKVIFSYIKKLDDNFTINILWKIKSSLVKKIKKKKKIVDKVKSIEVKLKNKTLCIESQCFKLLGIFLDKKYYASFYIQGIKNRLKTFKEGDEMNLSIKIQTIDANRIIFKDEKSRREWKIQLFDINSSKYKPKEFE
jgi:hypothetical protein